MGGSVEGLNSRLRQPQEPLYPADVRAVARRTACRPLTAAHDCESSGAGGYNRIEAEWLAEARARGLPHRADLGGDVRRDDSTQKNQVSADDMVWRTAMKKLSRDLSTSCSPSVFASLCCPSGSWMERCGLLPDTAAARPRAVEPGPGTAGTIGQRLPRAAKREQGRSACGGLRVCVRASCCDPRALCVRPCGHAVKAPPSGRERQ